jgi:hypothetical protein
MRVRMTRSCKSTLRLVGIAVITALLPLPAAADPIGKRTPTIKESAAKIVGREVAAAPTRPASAREDQQGSASTHSTSFFRTRPGMIALAVMAVGTGYALYSAHNDRIHSPGR